jgi:hypothetical protein
MNYPTSIILYSILFGVTQKLADSVNEHKTLLFNRADWFFGILFGISGIFLATFNSSFTSYFLGLVIYWLLSNKLDYFNHRLSASILLISIFFYTNLELEDAHKTIFTILLFSFSKGLKRLYSKPSTFTHCIYKYRIQNFLIALITGVYFNDYMLAISIVLQVSSILFTIHVLKAFNNYHEDI